MSDQNDAGKAVVSDSALVEAVTGFLFRFRSVVIVLFLAITAFFAYQAVQLRPDASIEKMIPVSHEYIVNYLDNRDDLSSLANAVRVIVASKNGDIFDKEFQQTLKEITDEVFYINGVDRSKLQSLWTPNVRWKEVTEEGFVGGSVIPDDYSGTDASLEDLRKNVLRSGQVGRLVSNDFTAAIVYVPLTETDPTTGKRLSYYQFSKDLEEKVRDKFGGADSNVSIHITGFVKVIGDLIEGAVQVGLFFAVAFLTTMILLYAYARCFWSTLIPLTCSLIAVVWQLGLLKTLGFGLDPFSMLVPFLVFAIGISHAVQMINGVANQCMEGCAPKDAAMNAFRNICTPGLVALCSDGIGFATLMVIEIPVIRELAIAASVGVAVLILTNLILLPILMSYTGITKACANRLKERRETGPAKGNWHKVAEFTTGNGAGVLVAIAMVLFAVGSFVSKDLKIGDLDPGAPELRPDSRYNLDNKFLTEKFSTSTDVFVTIVKTPPQQCGNYQTLAAINRFSREMKKVEGVQSVMSLVNVSKLVVTGMNESNIKWRDVSRNQYVLNNSLSLVPSSLINTDCSMAPVLLFLNDHKAETLSRVVVAAEAFAEKYNTDAVTFQLAAGNSGIEAVTNIVIEKAQYVMLALVYGVVFVLCWLEFRAIRIVICIVLPLALTSVLAQALMAKLGIGVKVATLPVIALGVGIGVDYGIYIFNKLREFLVKGEPLLEAYYDTLRTTGTAVAFTGITLAIGVGTWIYSPIKFQADMGLILTFMFLWNMIGAILLLPALAKILRVQEMLHAKNNK